MELLEIGERLAAAGLPDREGYAEWIATYASEEFGQLATWSRELTDAAAAEVPGPARRRMHAAFGTSSGHELAFWESAWSDNRRVSARRRPLERHGGSPTSRR